MGEFISLVDGHRHFGDVGRAECAVCCLEAERDALQAVMRDLLAEREACSRSLAQTALTICELLDERDLLRAAIHEVRRVWHERVAAVGTDAEEPTLDAWIRAWDEFVALDGSEVADG